MLRFRGREALSQNILRTAGGNELRMEDLRGEEHIALTISYGASQLNQGHIADEKAKRFELHADKQGVNRVAKGLFATAQGQDKAASNVLFTGKKRVTLIGGGSSLRM